MPLRTSNSAKLTATLWLMRSSSCPVLSFLAPQKKSWQVYRAAIEARMAVEITVTRVVRSAEDGIRCTHNSDAGTVAFHEHLQHAYDEQCRKIATTDPLGNVTRFGWDEASRLTSLTDPTGATTWIDYDSSGLPVRVVDPTGATTSHSFDDKGRLVERADSTGATELWRYDDEQNRVTWTDPTGRVVAVELDAAGLESAWTDAAGTSRVVRDARGLPVSQVDAVGAVSTFAWSGEGRLGLPHRSGRQRRVVGVGRAGQPARPHRPGRADRCP